jgi:hypothetical protein
MSMPRYRAVVLAAACALALAAPAGAAYATTAQHAAAKPVLTIGKKGGTAVKKGAVLKAGLAKGKSVVFTIHSSVIGTLSAKCKSSTLQAKVTANPASRGKATLSLTGETLRRCTVTGAPMGFTLKGVKALNLPYRVTISSAKGFPVTIAGRSKTKPLAFQATIRANGMGSVKCVFTAPKAKAHASNTGNKVSVTKQKLTFDPAASTNLCASAGVSSATYSATYGPIRDTSVRHSPKVFFN